MAKVFIPSQMQDLTDGDSEVTVEGRLLRHIIAALDGRYPGIAARICDGNSLAPGLAVAIDGVLATRGLLAPVAANSEVHFLPAISGGAE